MCILYIQLFFRHNLSAKFLEKELYKAHSKGFLPRYEGEKLEI